MHLGITKATKIMKSTKDSKNLRNSKKSNLSRSLVNPILNLLQWMPISIYYQGESLHKATLCCIDVKMKIFKLANLHPF